LGISRKSKESTSSPINHEGNLNTLIVILLGCADIGPDFTETGDSECVTAPVSPEPYSEHCKSEPPQDFDILVQLAAEERGINPRLLALTVYKESACDPDVTGSSGEIGLGQVSPKSWLKVLQKEGIIRTKSELYDPLTNLQSVSYILSMLYYSTKGDTQDAIRKYNGSGPRARRYSREQHNLYSSIWGEPVWFYTRLPY
jgi:hypothetical protein